MALSGTRRILRSGGGMRPYVSVQFGKPYVPVLPAGLTRKEGLRNITQEMMLRIATMLPPEQRGVYRDLLTEGL
ncbi:hypothetical protein [Dictyobacter formicarum]|uniref:hypothetical protein n=1 Tax=Dictyobacter formicarum TaxID=2778368 RepID=UPI0019164259|nr:hypothetical protein [Dictyobacter formicarum]